MKKKDNAIKWILKFISIFIALLSFFMIVTYVVDPFFRYRVRDNSYYLGDSRFVGAGLVRNYDYDTLFIGSSVTQNYDMEYAGEVMNCKPLLLGIGGMSLYEMTAFINEATSVSKAENYYLCIDPFLFRTNEKGILDKYLLEDTLISDVRYAVDYKIWTKYMPVDIGLLCLKKLGYDLPKKLEDIMSIERYEYWGDDYEYDEDIVIANYRSGMYAVSAVDTTNLYIRMKKNVDSFFGSLDKTNHNYRFYFPPYSVLCWYNAQQEGYMDIFLEIEQYFVEQAEMRGWEVYNFQSAECTMDLNNYRDSVHFKPEINDWMVDCFASGDYIVSSEEFIKFEKQMGVNVQTFKEKYDWLTEK